MNETCKPQHYPPDASLFWAGGKNAGIFLIRGGVVRLRVPGVPHLDRMFSSGSVLGLPSTFTGRPYSLTATCVTDCDVVHVAKKKFLGLMNTRPELCRDATGILSREVAFILSAFGKRCPAAEIEKPRRSAKLG